MKLAMFVDSGSPRLGVVEGEHVIDVLAGQDALPRRLVDWLPGGERSLAVLRSLAADAPRIPLAAVRLLPPIGQPPKFLAIGGNYQSHIDKVAHLGIPINEHQIWFSKQSSCIAGPYDDMVMPAVSDCLDYEAEMAVVIGRRCRHVKAADAAEYIAGYTVCNDASIRDWQLRTPTMMLGKSFDTHGPFGPWLVTPDEVGDPQSLWIRTWVNGELRQDGHTSEMRFDIAAQIEELSTVMTLEPGDVISTGSPAGTGIEHQPPRYLKVGDAVRIEIERIGFIENRVVADPYRG